MYSNVPYYVLAFSFSFVSKNSQELDNNLDMKNNSDKNRLEKGFWRNMIVSYSVAILDNNKYVQCISNVSIYVGIGEKAEWFDMIRQIP